ncbi:DUF6480 family protein [Streptomyces sp. NPDC058735]|uniref:DUF6480 family protein n=1 Tax=unclassified Streptomyces TaxID=2593676 RepID=UPI00367BA7A7
MSHDGPGPERSTGLEPGGGVPCMPEALPRETRDPIRGWAKAPLTVIMVLVILVVAFFLAYVLVLIL